MERSFRTFFTPEQLQAYQRGVMDYEYREVRCLKSPIDIAIYLRLIQESACRSIIEIGSKFGGSALMFRDFLRAIRGGDVRVVSIDLRKPDLDFAGVSFLEGDVHELNAVFSSHDLWSLPRPWLVIEDSAHTAAACRAALEFSAANLLPGEWLAIEDGSLAELGLGERFGGGPNEAISNFFDLYPDVFAVGAEYCDMFGPNATYNPNGYLRRTDVKWAGPR